MLKRNLAIALGIVAVFSQACERKKAGPPSEQTPPMSVANVEEVAPDKAKRLFENDYVELLEFNLKPGQRLPKHGGSQRVVCPLSHYQIDYEENGEKFSIALKEGDVHWHECREHAVKNIGGSDAFFITVNRKQAPLPAFDSAALEKDASKAAPERARVLMDNESVRVVQVNLNPGESLPMHQGIPRVLYALNDQKLGFSSGATGSTEETFKAGDVRWYEGGEHSVENTGSGIAEYLIVSWKK